MKAIDVLKKAEQHLVNKGITYDSNDGERSIPKVVKCFNMMTGLELSAEQGWMFMIVLKMVRSQQGKFKEDSYEDGAAYFALMCEEAARRKPSNPVIK